MAKDTFYFSHDYNTRSDEKIKKLIRTHGMVGYGLFWAIIEDLYQNNNSLELDYDLLAYEYRLNEDLIKSIINDFSLFTNDEKTFGSVSISKRIDIRNEKSKMASDNAYKRWGKSDARQKANDTIFYIIRMFSDSEEFIKCGITNGSISRRFSGKTSVYSYEVLKQYDIELSTALELENEINNKFNSYTPLNKFGGFLECYKVDDLMQILEIVMQCECKGNAIKESKVNNSIENESKENESKENEKTETETETELLPSIKDSNLFRTPKIPTFEEVHLAFRQNGGTEEQAKTFYDKNSSVGWFLKGSPITNFRNLIDSFISNWQKFESKNENKKQSASDLFDKLKNKN